MDSSKGYVVLPQQQFLVIVTGQLGHGPGWHNLKNVKKSNHIRSTWSYWNFNRGFTFSAQTHKMTKHVQLIKWTGSVLSLQVFLFFTISMLYQVHDIRLNEGKTGRN